MPASPFSDTELARLHKLYEEDSIALSLLEVALAYDRFWDNELHNDAFNHRISSGDLAPINEAMRTLKTRLAQGG
jgi:hypothetical protein